MITHQEEKFREIFLPHKGKELRVPEEFAHRDGKAGFLLESLFGLKPNTFSGPDTPFGELKTFCSKSSPISLFCIKTNRAGEFIKELHSKYSYIIKL